MNLLLVRWSVPVALGLFAVVDLVWPVLRHYRLTGKSGIAVHRADPAERVVGAALVVGIVALAAWGAAVAALGPQRLGVPAVGLGGVLAGDALMAAGVVVVAAAQAQMGRSWRVGIDAAPTELATGGLFAVVRNPIYAGMLLAVAGVVLVTPSLFTGLLAAELALWIALQTRLEEAHLLRLHGDAYARYGARVGRFVPGLGLL
jgi:protein-S-isoprenylcysteine O-methyltransferase Ste14